MNTNVSPVDLAKRYYAAMLDQDFVAMAHYLHPEVQFSSPLASLSGREAVVAAAEKLVAQLERINYRAEFSAGKQIMLAYDFIFHAPLGKLPAAVLMDMEMTAQQIVRIELFFDAQTFKG